MKIDLEVSEVMSLIAAIKDRDTALIQAAKMGARPSAVAVELGTLKRAEDKLREALEEREPGLGNA